MTKITKPILTLLLLLQAIPGFAEVITFPVGTTITTVRIDTGDPFNPTIVKPRVEAGNFNIDATGGVFINTNSNYPLRAGGIWNGNLFGQAGDIEISRADGGAFSFDSFYVLEKAGLACPAYACLPDAFTIIGFDAATAQSFQVNLFTDARNNTYDVLRPLATDARFANITKAIIRENETFLLDNVVVSAAPAAVPLPASIWMMGSALLGMFGAMRRSTNRKA